MKTRLLALILLFISGWSAGAAAQTDYLVGPADVVTITVFGEPELSGKFTVEQDGTFTFPQLGRVKAGGVTLRALETELKKQLADGYLRNPQVAVAIETFRSRRILIVGEVRSPGEYQMTGEMTLLSALTRAGSTTPAAGRQALIVRQPRRANGELAPLPSRSLVPLEDESETGVIRVDLGELLAGSLAMNVALQDGDTINVPKAQSIFVTGQVRVAGAYSIDPGTTVLQAITLAGGFTDRGADNRTRILRVVDGKQKEIKAKLSDLVLPGDTIIIKERFF